MLELLLHTKVCAHCAADVIRAGVPGSPAGDSPAPGKRTLWVDLFTRWITTVPISHHLPYITSHIQYSNPAGALGIAADRRCFCVSVIEGFILLGECTVSIAVVEQSAIEIISPGIPNSIRPTGCILPFSFCRQSAASPLAVNHGLFPGNTHNRVIPVS
jgi:hypothetical protein